MPAAVPRDAGSEAAEPGLDATPAGTADAEAPPGDAADEEPSSADPEAGAGAAPVEPPPDWHAVSSRQQAKRDVRVAADLRERTIFMG
ncbi:hypothetical protein Scel_00500 [Streptomyces cellostaticus]|nr:hypothetical protein Scel_00500 [Streptomyces cellostaticus]